VTVGKAGLPPLANRKNNQLQTFDWNLSEHMANRGAFIVHKAAIERDPALKPGGRGARKLVVTELYEASEVEATEITWTQPTSGAACPVRIMTDTEVAVFNQTASQDRHHHKVGTEIYMVLDGTMAIEVEGEDYLLSEGDMIVVSPNAVHEVKPAGTEFLCRVVTVNCGGANDKFTEEG
jgi:mannose-6-phosphate isomerase-like protein (cupin superfamily)